MEGVEAWNAWRHQTRKNPFDRVVLTGSVDSTGRNLQGINLSDLVVSGMGFRGANLRKADLSDSIVEFADFVDADLAGAKFHGASVYQSNFSRANLEYAQLVHCHFHEVQLTDANLRRALIADMTWARLDLSKVKELDTANHLGPSSIGIDTVFLSGGCIPEVFLREAGVPDGLIALQQSLVKGIQPIQFYSCFISYSHQDEDFAKRVRARLQEEGLRVWFAPEDMQGGRKLLEQVEEAIRLHDKLLLVLSARSMASNWVKSEVSRARKRELKEGKRVLFPIRLVDLESINDWEFFDSTTGIDYAQEIRSYFIPDFSGWKDHDSFEAAFKRLLSDLRASA
jgi:hypothetical protein